MNSWEILGRALLSLSVAIAPFGALASTNETNTLVTTPKPQIRYMFGQAPIYNSEPAEVIALHPNLPPAMITQQSAEYQKADGSKMSIVYETVVLTTQTKAQYDAAVQWSNETLDQAKINRLDYSVFDFAPVTVQGEELHKVFQQDFAGHANHIVRVPVEDEKPQAAKWAEPMAATLKAETATASQTVYDSAMVAAYKAERTVRRAAKATSRAAQVTGQAVRATGQFLRHPVINTRKAKQTIKAAADVRIDAYGAQEAPFPDRYRKTFASGRWVVNGLAIATSMWIGSEDVIASLITGMMAMGPISFLLMYKLDWLNDHFLLFRDKTTRFFARRSLVQARKEASRPLVKQERLEAIHKIYGRSENVKWSGMELGFILAGHGAMLAQGYNLIPEKELTEFIMETWPEITEYAAEISGTAALSLTWALSIRAQSPWDVANGKQRKLEVAKAATKLEERIDVYAVQDPHLGRALGIAIAVFKKVEEEKNVMKALEGFEEAVAQIEKEIRSQALKQDLEEQVKTFRKDIEKALFFEKWRGFWISIGSVSGVGMTMIPFLPVKILGVAWLIKFGGYGNKYRNGVETDTLKWQLDCERSLKDRRPVIRSDQLNQSVPLADSVDKTG